MIELLFRRLIAAFEPRVGRSPSRADRPRALSASRGRRRCRPTPSRRCSASLACRRRRAAGSASRIVALFANRPGRHRGAARLLAAQDWAASPRRDAPGGRAGLGAPDAIAVRTRRDRAGFWIVPSWHEVPRAQRVIRLDPGLAFGTGTHPTTRMCLRWTARRPALAPRWRVCSTTAAARASRHRRRAAWRRAHRRGRHRPAAVGRRAPTPRPPTGQRVNAGLPELAQGSTRSSSPTSSPRRSSCSPAAVLAVAAGGIWCWPASSSAGRTEGGLCRPGSRCRWTIATRAGC